MTFTFTVSPADWGRIAPVLVLVGMTLIIMLVDLALPHAGEKSKHSGPANFVVLPLLSLLAVLGAIAATIVLWLIGDHQRAFNQMVGSDPATLFAYLIILSASGLGILLSPAYLKRLDLVHQGEYYALMLLATTGMMLLAAATSFLMIFLGIEMFSLALYILCGFVARRASSQEAGMKYFLLSSFASAFLLYGIALIYGATGHTSFIDILHAFLLEPGTTTAPLHTPTILLIGMGLLTVGFAFKTSAIPFQAWTPDVYQGAPAPVTAFMSVGTKASALIAFARVFDIVLGAVKVDWLPIVWVIAVLTIVGGNIMALVQSNAKRMLGYSSIAHAGYLLIGIVVGGTLGVSAILFYLLCYAFMNLGAFGVVSMLERADNSGNDADDLRGLWYRCPVLAGFLAFFLLSLAGFPPMAGFAAKYYLFYAALVGGHPELLIIGVLASVLGMYYYLRIIATMFMEPAAASVAPAQAPLPGGPVTPRGGSRVGASSVAAARTSGALSTAGTATAVAPPKTLVGTRFTASSGDLSPTPAASRPGANSAPTITDWKQAGKLAWISWSALIIAALGTLAMGTLLPFWLTGLLQQAVPLMLR
ncbi:MAG TPA: NADH-quinone oxidoreductase subunit N [Ktedonosporobacter sp.]|jgi:NADH-quinone oxidoreductase subunit N|nr:NADH-quinone oxidoreductase subunit N [Ktedonosporobacter sp.]